MHKMKKNPSGQKNYYELLDIPIGASKAEIDEAFKKAKSFYGGESPALYSLYSPEEREQLLLTIMEAYETLKDPEKKNAYDIVLKKRGQKKGTVPSLGGLKSSDDITFLSRANKVSLRPRRFQIDKLDPMSTEQYRVLFTKLEEVRMNKSYKVFALTSTTKNEGKTLTAFNLAHLISQEFRKKVLIIDCDLKKTSLTNDFLNLPKISYGMIEVLKGEVGLDHAIAEVKGNENLFVIPVCKNVKDSAKILASREMQQLLERVKSGYDYVFLDCPPITPLADMNILSKIVDGILFVVAAGKAHRDMVLKAANSMKDGDIVGIILNNADMSLGKYNYY